MTEPTLIFHNPRCSKSRQTLALLQERGIEPEIIRYLDTPPSEQELTVLLRQLGLAARALLRKGEAAYKELGLDDQTLPEQTLIGAMVKAPILIERPIVIHNNRAVLGRPPEQVLDLF
ncbi:arsenate reductase (glutaredoxin) [Marinobacter caseinilyticus]|uniref:arsenate reductase (glutaredoxin) n=1 Tax=Marinobacter caseinilyticus TaxID=2692195 RepID=UPI00140A4142|nr:arsenate reductase (glutaredoxin) [Marinobacter caseinilyticus]